MHARHEVTHELAAPNALVIDQCALPTKASSRHVAAIPRLPPERCFSSGFKSLDLA